MDFTSTKIKADIEGLKDFFEARGEDRHDWDSHPCKVIIDWRVVLITASWGISSIIASTIRVDGKLEMWKGDEDDQKNFKTINFDIKASLSDSCDWKIYDDIKPQAEGEFLSVTQVIINIHTKQIFVS
jgi:hypothetical protein